MRTQRARAVELLCIVVGVVAACGAGLSGGVFAAFDRQAGDALAGRTPVDERIVVVGIDQRTIDESRSPWPWSRTAQAELLRRLAPARLLLYDVVLSPASSDDAALARVLAAQQNVVLAVAPDARLASGGRLPRAEHVSRPAPDLVRAAAAVGHVNVHRDPADGVVRDLPLVVEEDLRAHVPSLSLAALMQLEDVEAFTLRPDGVQVGAHLVPSGTRANLRVAFSDGLRVGGGAYVSAADVLNGSAATLAGKIVLVGITDPTLGDTQLTPTAKGSGQPGVFIHANALNTMLTGNYLRVADRVETLFWILVLVSLSAGAFRFLQPQRAVLVATPALVMWLFAAALRYHHGTVPSLVYPALAWVLGIGATVAVRYVSEDRERRRVVRLFSQYVPDRVVERLLASRAVDEALAGQRADVSVLFCDLRGFTALAATLEPPAVKRLLDVYYRHATDVVCRHDGTLLQFVGDEVFAVFGVPVQMDDHADRALACARDLHAVRRAIADDLADDGVPPIDFGIGLHAGEVVAAHVGTDARRQYGVVGNTVNVGARLCSIAKAGDIVLSAQLASRLSVQVEGEDVGPIELKGVSEPVRPRRLAVGPIS